MVATRMSPSGGVPWQVSPRGEPGEDPKHAGTTVSLSCPENTLEPPLKSCRNCLGSELLIERPSSDF